MISLSFGLFEHFRQWNEMQEINMILKDILSSELSEHFSHWKEMYEIDMILKDFKIYWSLWTIQTMKWDARNQHDLKRFIYLLN